MPKDQAPNGSASDQPILLAYVPVLHAGYRQWFNQHPEAKALYVLGKDLIAEFDHLQRKDIRALSPSDIITALQSWNLPWPIYVLTPQSAAKLNQPTITLIAPREDEMQSVIEQHLNKAHVTFENVWLRWDRRQSHNHQDVVANTTVSEQEFDQHMMDLADEQASNSSDWWRQIGAVLVQDGRVLLAGYNQHVPHPQMPYINGDPRGNFHKGEYIELSSAIHAEAGLIAAAAKQGLSLQGASLYVTTFPCPNCAKLIAYSGISQLYFREGYAMIDGESILRSQGVELIRVAETENSAKK